MESVDFIELFQYFGNKHRIVGFLVSVLVVAFIGMTDYLTGSELAFSIFYLFPISFAVLFLGKWTGCVICFVSAGTWLAADLCAGAHYSHVLIPYWNAMTRLGYFVLHAVLLRLLMTSILMQKRLTRIDLLTGIANWRHFEDLALREIAQSRRSGKPLTLAYVDLDNFKTVNDSLGHDVGDHVIKTIAEIIQGQLRSRDIVARLGGDEFAILLPETDVNDAATVLNRTREAVTAEIATTQWPVTLSVGAVTYTSMTSSFDAMLKRADGLMYEVKYSGKNNMRHIQWPPPVVANVHPVN